MVKYASMFKWYALALAVLISDQATKLWADSQLSYASPENIFPGFNLTLVYNPGAAFSFLGDAGGWQRWLFTGLAVAVSIYIIYWIRQLKPNEHTQGLGLGLILGGAIGNLIDRVLYGHVIDFFDAYYPSQECLPFFYSMGGQTCHWPVFNIADMGISIGAGLLIISVLRTPSS